MLTKLFSKGGICWDNILLSIVTTSVFIRHAQDGNLNPSCIKALLVGLLFAVDNLKQAPRKLQGWVSEPPT